MLLTLVVVLVGGGGTHGHTGVQDVPVPVTVFLEYVLEHLLSGRRVWGKSMVLLVIAA